MTTPRCMEKYHGVFLNPMNKHKEAFSTLVESLTQMTRIDFTNFLKLVQFTI